MSDKPDALTQPLLPEFKLQVLPATKTIQAGAENPMGGLAQPGSFVLATAHPADVQQL
ncbi:MAG: hypothetical protein V4534_07950 [Myxococcota bacterium]